MRLTRRVLLIPLLLLSICILGNYSIKAEDEQYSYGININMPTQLDIKYKIEDLSEQLTKYSSEPDLSAPYSAGNLKDDTLNNALLWINAVRYIAGIDEVTLNKEYCEYAQAASIVNFINDLPSHTPDKPSGMSDSLYQKGYEGSGKCDISYGYGLDYGKGVSFGDIIINNWMNDGDENNIWCLGHRRWILNPAMSQTGFGCIFDPNNKISKLKYIAALYAMDKKNSSSAYGICWPAHNTPTSFFDDDYPWSISMGKNVSSDTVVEIIRQSDNKKWTFSNGSANYYINNDGYGLKGCIIFKPVGITTNAGDTYKVNISGSSTNVQYYVNFFDIDKVSDTSIIDPIDNPDNNDPEHIDDPDDTDIIPTTIIKSNPDNTEETNYIKNTSTTNKDGSKTEIKFDTSNKKEVTITIKNTTKSKQVETITYVIIDDNKLKVKSINTKSKSLTIANTVTINGKKFTVTEIGENILAKNKTVTKIKFNSELKYIHEKAFQNNTKIKNITIIANDYLTIDADSFLGINNKAKFIIKGTKKQFESIKLQLLFAGKSKSWKIVKK